VTGPKIAAALERAGLVLAAPDTTELIDFGLRRIQGGDDDVLEITQAFWQTETHGGESITILTREMLCVVLAPVATGILRRKKSAPVCAQIPFAAISDLIDDDAEMGGAAVFFVGAEENPDFVLRFERSAERDRFYPCVFAAHRGEFSRWGMQLDPANYVADFERFHAELIATGIEDGSKLHEWVEGQYGDFRIDNALGLALEWRTCELDDLARPADGWRRVGRVGSPSPWGDVPESRPVFVKLGEQLFDAGMLAPPYDERSFPSDEPLGNHDAGPLRLLAVMALAGYARALRDPRAQEFIDGALPHLGEIPAAIFHQSMRELWADIAPLPSPKEPREFEIWEDAEVKEISTFEENRVVYDPGGLRPGDKAQIDEFMAADAHRDDDRPETHVGAALAGIKAYEELSPLCPPGWRKLVVYTVSERAHEVWRGFQLAHETAMLAQWVTVTIEANDWGPDGNSTPLGQHHSFAMSLAADTGIGVIVIDPETGRASAPTGEEARHAAREGAFR
jgi:hypothetical protein